MALLALWASGVAAGVRAQQPLSVQPQRDLAFGDVVAGIPKSISRLDPASSGMLEVRGARDAEVAFTFTLPPALIGVAGRTLTVEFGIDDGGFSRQPNQASSVGFDPRVPYTNRLSRSGRAHLWLGGTVRPTTTQAAGPYQATVTLTVSYTGN